LKNVYENAKQEVRNCLKRFSWIKLFSRKTKREELSQFPQEASMDQRPRKEKGKNNMKV